MKIEFNELLDKEFYKELLCVSENYKKIKKNPNKKIIPNTKILITLLILDLILAFFFITDYIQTKDSFDVIMLGIIICTVFYILTYLFIFNKRVKELLNNSYKSILEINESSVKLIQEGVQTVELDWNLIEFILISKHTICFVPKRVNNLMICIPIDKKETIIEGIKKYNQEKLIVDNEILYK